MALLATFLQRMPVLGPAVEEARSLLEAPLGSLIRGLIIPLAALGAVDSVAGASSSSSSSAYMVTDIQLPADITVGAPFKMDVTVAGPAVTFAKSWDVSAALPPGLAVKGASMISGKWVINDASATSGILTLSGTPTTTGSYTVTFDAFMNTNRSGSETSGSIIITVLKATVTGTAPTISAQPSSETVSAGSGASLGVTAAGTAPLSYQWSLDGSPIPGATSATYSVASADAADAGTYTVSVTNAYGTVASKAVSLTVNLVNAAPAFTSQPSPQTVASGATVVFHAAASAYPAPAYQWYLNGAALPAATGPLLEVAAAGAADAGNYTCSATNSQGSATSAAAALAVVDSSYPGHLVNLSCRAQVGTGGNMLIMGFVVGGQGTSGSESVLVRASGPALGSFGVPGFLPDPQLTLDQSTAGGAVPVDSDSGWNGSPAVAAAAAQVGAFPWANSASKDSALVDPLQGGAYTAQVAGASGDTGVSLAEAYDLTAAGAYTAASPRLVNISARVEVGTGGNILIVGFVISGETSETVLIRGSGPALAAFGVGGVLPDPELALFASGTGGANTLVEGNTGWGGDPVIAVAAGSVGAFPWGSGATPDSAILATLPPGAYTAEVSGAAADTGVALVEVYEVP